MSSFNSNLKTITPYLVCEMKTDFNKKKPFLPLPRFLL